MIVSKICKYLRQCNEFLKVLHIKEGIPMPFLWIDSTYALLRHGILIKQYTIGSVYKLPHVKLGGVFSQRRLERIIAKYNKSSDVHYLQNKNEFNQHFRKWVHRQWLDSNSMSEKDFTKLVENNGRLFVKPLDAQEGEGIRTMRLTANDIHEAFQTLKRENVIIEEAIVQHQKMNFGNVAVNTVRVITCMDRHGQPHILRAALRVGVGDSVVDNFTAGGALYDIDIETGVIDMKGIGHDYVELIYHPGTDICMLGYQLPNWDVLVIGVKEAAKALPTCRFIGWDVAITETGIELIEGNHNPGLYTMESIGKPCSYADAVKLFEM